MRPSAHPDPLPQQRPLSRRAGEGRGGGGLTARIALAALLLGTTACAVVPASDLITLKQTEQPRIATDSMVAIDGTPLPLRLWEPPKGAGIDAVIVALHGFNDYSNAFQGPGTAWAAQGIATLAYDQRGFGAAPERGRWAGRQVLAQDAATATRLARARYPGVPVYLLGESMGGAVALAAATRATAAEPPVCDGLILIAPAVWGRRTMGIIPKAALWLASHTIPDMTFTGSGLHIMPSDNIEMLRAFVRDPLVIRSTRVDAIKGLVDLMDVALDNAPRLDLPTLLLYGDKDEVIPKDATRTMVDELSPDARRQVAISFYPHGYHMLMRDLEAAVVLADVAAWVKHPGVPLPSGFDRNARARLEKAE